MYTAIAAHRWRFEPVDGGAGRWWYEVTVEGPRGARYEVSVVKSDHVSRPIPFRITSGRTTRSMGPNSIRRRVEEAAREAVLA